MRFSTSAKLHLMAACCYLQGSLAFVARPALKTASTPASAVSTPAFLATRRTILTASKKDQSFPTWSFDAPCTSMQWSELVQATLTLGEVTDTTPDLVIVGVLAPPKKDKEGDDEDEDEDDESNNGTDEKEPEPVVLTGTAKKFDEELQGALADLLQDNEKKFKNGAKIGSTSPTLRVAADKRRVIVLGLGAEGTDEKPKDWSGAGATLGKTIASKVNDETKVSVCQVILPSAVTSNATVMTDFSTAFYQALYSDNRYRTGKKIKKPAEHLKSVVLTTDGAGAAAAVDDSVIEQGRMLARGIFLTKDIVNAPHNVLNSLSLADTAKRLAEESGGALTLTILDKEACEERGMGAYLGVARGSETPPQFIHLTYKGEGDNLKKLGIVGKGLLFDTGGYNIKTQMMEFMKFDCGGAAAVLGAARAIAALKPPGVEAHFIVAACENMINEKAYVPSDILTASNGKTIEVMNTDAEGRLTLADALVYADKEIGCETIIELSTLTGACLMALGKDISGVWTSNDELAQELADISKVTGDKSWRMPLAKEYNEMLESKFADIKNVGGKYGGAITAALFLQHFVSSKKPFAHIDIAGPVWSDKDGATGYGAKLVTEWVTRQGKKSASPPSE